MTLNSVVLSYHKTLFNNMLMAKNAFRDKLQQFNNQHVSQTIARGKKFVNVIRGQPQRCC